MKVNIKPHPTREGWYYLEYRPDGIKGKRERKRVMGYDLALARKKQLEGSGQVDLYPRLKDVYQQYLAWVDKYKAATTRQNKRCRLTRHIIPALGSYRVRDLSQTILDDYGKDMAKASYRDDVYHLLALIKWMTQRHFCKPLDWKPETPSYKAPVKSIPAPEDILLFLSKIKKADQRTLFSLMLYTGLRWDEASRLRWEDYQGDSFRLSDTKTDVQERIFIPEPLQQWFKDNKEDEGWIFTVNGKKPYTNLQRCLILAGKASGIVMTPHLFRHASATFLYQITKDLYAVKNHLRHSRITTTEIYTRYSVEQSKQAVTSLSKFMDNFKTPPNTD